MSAQPSLETWQSKGACRGPHAQVFFPPSQFERKHERIEREAKAKEICASCAVQKDCRDYAMAIREPHGIWGGMSESERRALIETAVGVR
ncbi:MAG: WhiB family transcriptional regulator [Microthrixaceae bacterium]